MKLLLDAPLSSGRWHGIDAWLAVVCSSDDACSALINPSRNTTIQPLCYKGFTPLKQNYLNCRVKSNDICFASCVARLIFQRDGLNKNSARQTDKLIEQATPEYYPDATLTCNADARHCRFDCIFSLHCTNRINTWNARLTQWHKHQSFWTLTLAAAFQKDFIAVSMTARPPTR